MTTPSPAAPRRNPGRPLLALGLGLPALGVAAYAAQIWAKRLTTPWYLPVAATLGAFLVAASLRQARTAPRWLALVLVLLLAGAEWAFLLATRLPAYAGPVAEGRPFPAFATVRADGTPFTQHDLAGGPDSVLV